ncbi:ATP-binding protein [Roseibacillus persicicus]|uniref:histidine kinase n=1 Tax=Roseibacillus persicicus TaxID=454148 RepID=A0A918WFL3_9BACT|nr:ATP-binding protein [Roseibacillus persicicus]GHC41457.1 hypothetical protein GCM10007100_02790 [Roseibacillus persicicus]
MKRKILFGIAIFLLLLFGTGLSAMWLLNQTSRTYSETHRMFHQHVSHLNSLRFETSAINTHYLPDMFSADDPLPRIKPSELFDNSFANMRESIWALAESNYHENSPSFERLAAAVDAYGSRYTQLFQELPNTREGRNVALSEIGLLTQQVSQLTSEESDFLGRQVEEDNQMLRRSTLQSNTLIGFLLLSGVSASIVIFFQGNRLMVDPLVNLTDSVKEIQRGNFELTLPVRNSTDEIAQLIPAFNDMASELRLMRRTTDEKLLKSDQQSRTILANFPHPIVLLSNEGTIEKMNPSAEELFEQMGILGALPRNISERVNEAISSNKELLVERLDEALLLRVDESEHFYLPRIFRLSDNMETTGGWALLLINVTRLRFFDDMKSNLISTVSHEIKTPLTGIRMVLLLLLEKKVGELNELQEEMLTSAQNDCERLLETLRNLLEMSRMDSGASSLNCEEIAPLELVEPIVSNFAPLAEEKDLNLKIEIPDETPNILVDRIRISEVLNNFLSNAIKHSPQGGTITVTARPVKSDYVRIGVYDEGEGVPEEAKPHIFERFYRAPGQNNVEGIGLGLSIAREIVSAHEGRIGYLRTSEDRTLFYCNLPRI